MTMHLGSQQGETLTLRYIPLFAWAFVAFMLYGVATILIHNLSGSSAVAISLLLSMAGFVAYRAGQVVVCVADRAQNALRLTRYGLQGRESLVRPLDEVVGIEVQLLRQAQQRIVFRFRSGERLHLTPYYIFTLRNRTTDLLARFLAIQPEIQIQKARLRS